jgi:hypothetical protein
MGMRISIWTRGYSYPTRRQQARRATAAVSAGRTRFEIISNQDRRSCSPEWKSVWRGRRTRQARRLRSPELDGHVCAHWFEANELLTLARTRYQEIGAGPVAPGFLPQAETAAFASPLSQLRISGWVGRLLCGLVLHQSNVLRLTGLERSGLV